MVAAVVALALIPLVRVPTTAGAFTAVVQNSVDSAATASAFSCDDTFAANGLKDQAYFEYTLTDAAATARAADQSTAGNDGAYRPNPHLVDQSAPRACPASAGPGSWQLDGSSSFVSTAQSITPPPADFSLVVWFKSVNPGSSTTRGGLLIGLSAGATNESTGGDRFLYVDNTGLLRFGIYSNSRERTIASSVAVDDGVWHQAVATLSSATGMTLYLDGAVVSTNTAYTTAQAYSGQRYWRLGNRTIGSAYPNPPPAYFTGSMRFAAAYKVVLGADEVAAEWRNGRPA